MSTRIGSVFELLSGQVDPREPPIDALIIVNPAEDLPTGWGAGQAQQYQSGPTNNRRVNASAEQGQGVGPERKWSHYPHAVNPNPFRNANVHQRAGTDAYSADVYRVETAAYWPQALVVEQVQAPAKQRGPVAPVVNQEPTVPFVQTVPARGGSPGGYFG